jgi:adhesin transport system outer membrane protein
MAMTLPPFHRAGTWLLCSLLWPAAWAADADHAIESLLNRALDRNPAVRATVAQAEAADQDIGVAKLGLWPSIQLSGEANTAGNGTALVVEQPLWSAGAITSRIDEARRLSDVSKAQIDVSRGQIGLRIVDAWQSLMDASASLRVYQESLVQYERYEALMRRRVEAQVSAAIELQLLASRTLQARVDVNEARTLQRVALSRLEQIVGDKIDAEQQAQLARILSADAMQSVASVKALETLLSYLDQHPSVRRARHETEVAEERLIQQRAQAWPQVVLRYRRQLSGTVATGTDRDQVAIALNYAPGSGFSTLARANADAQRLVGFELATDAIVQDLNEQVRVEWEGLRRDIDRQGVQNQAIISAREVLASYERQFTAGRKSWLDVLNALRELTQSEIRLAQAQASATAGLYRLRLRSGALPGDNHWKVQP